MNLSAQHKYKQKSRNVWSSWIELDSCLHIVLFSLILHWTTFVNYGLECNRLVSCLQEFVQSFKIFSKLIY